MGVKASRKGYSESCCDIKKKVPQHRMLEDAEEYVQSEIGNMKVYTCSFSILVDILLANGKNEIEYKDWFLFISRHVVDASTSNKNRFLHNLLIPEYSQNKQSHLDLIIFGFCFSSESHKAKLLYNYLIYEYGIISLSLLKKVVSRILIFINYTVINKVYMYRTGIKNCDFDVANYQETTLALEESIRVFNHENISKLENMFMLYFIKLESTSSPISEKMFIDFFTLKSPFFFIDSGRREFIKIYYMSKFLFIDLIGK